jgi:ribosomal protein L14E/L6E/L27E
MGLSVLKGFLYCLYYETVPTDVNSAYKNGSREHEHEKRNEKLNLRSKWTIREYGGMLNMKKKKNKQTNKQRHFAVQSPEEVKLL